MSVSLGSQEHIQTKYNLTDEQYTRLMGDVGKLSPQQQAAVTEAYVLTWKAMDEGGGDSAADLPTLKASDLGSVLELAGWNASAAYASPGAAISALITELSAEQREQNRNQYMAEADSIASTIKDQATDIREKADKQWKMAVVSGAVSCAAGAVSVVGSSISLGRTMSAINNITSDGALNARIQNIQNFNTIFQGTSQTLTAAAGTFSAYGQKAGLEEDAQIKEKDALIEQKRAVMENLRSLDQSLTEVIQKSLSSAEAIQQGLNQTRNRILG